MVRLDLSHGNISPGNGHRQAVWENHNYAKEELRAELASVFLMAERGIPHNPDSHAAYLGSWLKALRDDKHEIFRAARDAHKAADLLLALEMHKLLSDALAAASLPATTTERSQPTFELDL